MIMLEQPSLSLNSCDVPGPHYRMWRTVSMPKGMAPVTMVETILKYNAIAQTTFKRSLANVVINCHGYGSGLGLMVGGEGEAMLDQNNVSLFSMLAKTGIGPIWLVACQAARSSFGVTFCQTMANLAKTVVIAGEDDQELGVWNTVRYHTGPANQIDEYEGMVYLFYANNTYVKGIDPERELWSVKV